MDCVVAPLLHKYDVDGVAVKVTLPPAHTLVEPLAEMVAVGAVVLLTTM
jgi:hypothetical protein